MKCELCEFELNETEMEEQACRLDTSQPPAKITGIVFGIWNHRENRVRSICGACLCDRLGISGPKPRGGFF